MKNLEVDKFNLSKIIQGLWLNKIHRNRWLKILQGICFLPTTRKS